MTFTWPWMLLSIPLILAAAVWVLVRPRRMHVTVGSTRLWSEALASLSATGRPRRNRIVLSWIFILLGCLLLATALARPARHTTRLIRRIELIVSPTAEFAMESWEWGEAVRHVLRRLDRRDRVRLTFPSAMGGEAEWLSPPEVAAVVKRTALIPGRFEDMTFPAIGDVDQTLAIIPAGQDGGAVDADIVIEVPTSLPSVTIDRLTAAFGPDRTVQTFLTLRNNYPLATTVELTWMADGSVESLVVPGDGTKSLLHSSDRTEYVGVCIDREKAPRPELVGAFLVYREMPTIRVALTGRSSPAIQRYIQADDNVELVADPEGSDVVIAVGGASDHRGSILIDPPSEGPFAIVGALSDVPLGEVAAMNDSSILAGVDWGDVGVRRVNLLRAGGMPLASHGSNPILFADMSPMRGPQRRDRIVIPFNISPENTNWTLTPSFAIFMANAVRWAAGRPESRSHFETQTPLQMECDPSSLKEVERLRRGFGWGPRYVSPGLYRRSDNGELVAVSLVGLHGKWPGRSVGNQLKEAELCDPSYRDEGTELWGLASLAGLVCLLTGWFVAGRLD